MAQNPQTGHPARARKEVLLVEEHPLRVPETVDEMVPVADAQSGEHEVIEVDEHAEPESVHCERRQPTGRTSLDSCEHPSDDGHAEQEVLAGFHRPASSR